MALQALGQGVCLDQSDLQPINHSMVGQWKSRTGPVTCLLKERSTLHRCVTSGVSALYCGRLVTTLTCGECEAVTTSKCNLLSPLADLR